MTDKRNKTIPTEEDKKWIDAYFQGYEDGKKHYYEMKKAKEAEEDCKEKEN